MNRKSFQDTYRHKGLRKALIRTVRGKGIKDEKLLEAMNKVPRHYFFDDIFLEHAYEDKAFPIGQGQTISQPYTVAFQTELLEIEENDKVLEIGTGSGYQACILLELGAKVFTIEYNKVLYDRTKVFLPSIGYKPYFFFGDGSKGLSGHSPYNKILVTAGAPIVPKPLVDQLEIGGILVIPVGNHEKQRMIRLRKISENKIKKESFDYFSFVPLLGNEGWKENH